MSRTTLDPTLVLNVDDHAANRYAKSRILKRASFEVIEAGTGEAALRLLRERMPALVLLDVKLPDMNGRDICALIKSDRLLARIAVLQTSASHIDSKHRVASLDAGADGYLVEPMEPEELVANVRALLRMRKAEDERQAALEALQEADRRKDEFLAMLAHELRNPLAPIRNAVEIMRTEDPAIREKARAMIGRQVQHLVRLVDDLLEVSRITQRKVALQRLTVRLVTIVESATEVARSMIDARAQAFTVTLPQEDLWLHADPVRLSQVIGNLLNNAAKFTPTGGTISLVARRAGEALEIIVEDNGEGIAPGVLPTVFDLFTQGERTLERTQGGLGIGLSLVKGLVQMHGGSVAAESGGQGQGSRFVISLPGSMLREAPPTPAVSAPRAPAGRKRILVVEDNADTAEATQMLLCAAGHEVAVVHDGREAVSRACEFLPDIILLDIGLPGIDGYELAGELRRIPQTREARMIAVSGYGQQKDRERSREAGFDLHLVKPVDPTRLADVIEGVES